MTPNFAPRSAGWQRRAHVGAWLFALSLFGYPVVGALVSMLQVDSRAISIPFRLAVGVFALWTLLLPSRLQLDTWRLLLLLIFGAFMIRLCYDGMVAQVEGAEYALQFFIVGSLLPALAIWKLDAFDQRLFGRATFIVASAGCLIVLFGHFAGAFGEADLTEATGRLSTTALNPVSLGYLAVGGLFSGVVLWSDVNRPTRVAIGSVCLVLVLVLMLTGSKGPALVLVTGLALWSLRRGRVTLLALMTAAMLALLLLFNDSALVTRIYASAEDLSTLDRLDLIDSSLRQIVDAPWIGSAFVDLESGFYAHSIFLEAPMSFGIPLTIVLLGILFRGAVLSWRVLGTRNELAGLLYIEGLISSVISSSMYGATMLWVSLIVVLGLVQPRWHRARRPRSRISSRANAQGAAS